MVYGVHFLTAYNSSLINILTQPRHEHQIDKVENLIEKNYEFVGGINAKLHFIKDDKVLFTYLYFMKFFN